MSGCPFHTQVLPLFHRTNRISRPATNTTNLTDLATRNSDSTVIPYYPGSTTTTDHTLPALLIILVVPLLAQRIFQAYQRYSPSYRYQRYDLN
jgi:hypothetical protein